MNVADIGRGLLRRWYIVVPGLIVAVAVSFGVWNVVKPGYERSAVQLLLPGPGTLPETASNPYLFIGGLSQAADVLVRAVGSEAVLDEILDDYPDTDITVSRDPTTPGPVILISVTARSDAAAAAAVDRLVTATAEELERLQSEQEVPEGDRVTASTVAVDQRSELQQRERLVVSAGVGVAIVALALVAASVMDGLTRRVHAGGRSGRAGGTRGSREPRTDDEFRGRQQDQQPEPAALYDEETVTDTVAIDLSRLLADEAMPVEATTPVKPAKRARPS